MSTASRYARAGFRPLLPVHEALVQAAEALRGGCQLEELPDRSCGMAVVHGSRVLLIHQKTATGTHWALPKGHPEAGESDLAAALREVREEAGFEVAAELVSEGTSEDTRYTIAGQLWGAAWTSHASYPDPAFRACVYHKTARYFLARLPQGSPLPEVRLQEEEVHACEWLPFAEGVERLTFADERLALQRLLQKLQ
jgi:bis(5'-nucleosidyl)-tetraphosphatase